MKILVLDNYDSFVYNLVHVIEALGYSEQCTVVRNDQISIDEVEGFDKILLSPGPGIPEEAGIMPALIQRYKTSKDFFGVCLGHQALAEGFGGQLHNIPEVLHGIADLASLTEEQDLLFNNMPATFRVGHYHSWVVEPGSLPDELLVTATDERGHIMALRHRTLKVRGVQFHPESILTEHGDRMLKNWLAS